PVRVQRRVSVPFARIPLVGAGELASAPNSKAPLHWLPPIPSQPKFHGFGENEVRTAEVKVAPVGPPIKSAPGKLRAIAAMTSPALGTTLVLLRITWTVAVVALMSVYVRDPPQLTPLGG